MVSVNDTPNPAESKNYGGETLQDRGPEGCHIATVSIDQGGNEGSEAWLKDVENEDQHGDGLTDIDPGFFAAWKGIFGL